MQFLYFVRNITADQWRRPEVRAAVAAERGLSDLFADVADDGFHLGQIDGSGPGGASGVLVVALAADGQRPGRMGYYPEIYQWAPRDETELVWTGLDPGRRPRPEDLLRRKPIAGHAVPLGDGQDWQVPIVRRPLSGDTGNLPRRVSWDRAGRLVCETLAAHVPLFEACTRAWDWFTAQPGREHLEIEWLADFAARLLAVNYRLGKPEISRLGLLEESSFEALVAAAIDWPLIEERVRSVREKKTAAPPSAAATRGSPES